MSAKMIVYMKKLIELEENGYYVFDIVDNKMKQISISFETLEDAESFCDTMREGRYYKSMHPEAKLIIMQLKKVHS